MSNDLLNLHITNILENEKLIAVYVVNGEAKYASLQSDNKYNLYTISNYEIDEYIGYSDTIGRLDFIVGERLNTHILSQSAIHRDIIRSNNTQCKLRIVTYVTDETNLKDLKKPTSSRDETTRYISKKLRKLF